MLPRGGFWLHESVNKQRDWCAVAADVLEWYETGEFELFARRGYRPQRGDFRLVLAAEDEPGLARVYFLPAHREDCDEFYRREVFFAGYRLSYVHIDSFAPLTEDEDNYGYLHAELPKPRTDQCYYIDMYPYAQFFHASLLGFSRQGTGVLYFAPEDLPANFEPFVEHNPHAGPEVEPRPVRCVVEPADSPESVLSGTKVFAEWWEKYGPLEKPEK
jgi:hypothetical protein